MDNEYFYDPSEISIGSFSTTNSWTIDNSISPIEWTYNVDDAFFRISPDTNSVVQPAYTTYIPMASIDWEDFISPEACDNGEIDADNECLDEFLREFDKKEHK